MGSSKLSPFLNDLHTPILSSNIILNSADEGQKLQKSIIFDIKGVKVGLVGYLTPESSILDSAGEIEYVNEIIALQDEVAKLKAQNVNIIIALGHSDIIKDTEIAREVDGVDLVIGGQKNIFYWNGENVNDQQFEHTVYVTQQSGKRVPIVQSYTYNHYLGQLTAKFNSEGDLIEVHAEPILLDRSIPQDVDSLNIVKKHQQEFERSSSEILGQTVVRLDGNSCSHEECNLGNMITDAMMYNYAINFQGSTWTDAPITVIPGGYIAASIATGNRPASVTRGDLLSALPRESTVVAVTMNGDVLHELLEHSGGEADRTRPSGRFLQLSGIRVTYDFSRDIGSRIINSAARCWNCNVPQYFEIDSWRNYTVLMPESLANGDYGYSMLENLPRQNLPYDEVTCTANYITLRTPVYPEISNRIRRLNDVEPVPDSATTASFTVAWTTCLLLFSRFAVNHF